MFFEQFVDINFVQTLFILSSRHSDFKQEKREQNGNELSSFNP